MGFNFKSLFIVDTEDPVSKQEEKVQLQSNSGNVKVEVSDVKVKSESHQHSDDINTELLDKLATYIENNQLEGPDYIELKKAANSEGMKTIPDESVRFQAAYATIKSIHPNFSKEIVISSIEHYIKILNEQNNIAKKQVEDKRKAEVLDKKNNISKLENRISELQKEIVSISTQISTMKTEVETADNECNKMISDFDNAVNLIISNLEKDKKNVLEKLVS